MIWIEVSNEATKHEKALPRYDKILGHEIIHAQKFVTRDSCISTVVRFFFSFFQFDFVIGISAFVTKKKEGTHPHLQSEKEEKGWRIKKKRKSKSETFIFLRFPAALIASQSRKEGEENQ